MESFLNLIENWGGPLAFLASLFIIIKSVAGPIYTRLSHVEKQVDNHIPSQIRELDQKIDRNADQTNQRFDRINQRFDQVNQRFDQINQKIDQSASQTNQRLDKLFEILSKEQQKG